MKNLGKTIWSLFGRWFVKYMLDNMGEVEKELQIKWQLDGVPSDPKIVLADLKAALIKSFLTL